MKLRALFLSVATLASSGFALAQAPGGGSPDMRAARDAVLKACASEISSVCAGKEGRELMMCLRTSTDKESPSCKDAVSKLPQRPAAP
jgi:hypothetical protein